MIETFSDLRFNEGRLVSTAEEIIQYVVNGFLDDCIYYQGCSEERAKAYRSELIKDLKKGVIPSGLHMNFSMWRLGIRRTFK